jgi:hypothetical protein
MQVVIEQAAQRRVPLLLWVLGGGQCGLILRQGTVCLL